MSVCSKGTGVFMPLVCRDTCKQGFPEHSQVGAPLPSASPQPAHNAGLNKSHLPCSCHVGSPHSHVRHSADRFTQCCSQQPAAAPARRSTFPGAGSHPPTSPDPRRHSCDSPYGSAVGHPPMPREPRRHSSDSPYGSTSGGGCGRGPGPAELPWGSSSCRSSPLPTAAFRQPQHSSPGAAGYPQNQQGGGDAVLCDLSGTSRSRSSPLHALPQHHLQQQQQQRRQLPQEEEFASLASNSVPSRTLCAVAGVADRLSACSSSPFDAAPWATSDVMAFSPEVKLALSPRPSSGLSWGDTAAPAPPAAALEGDWDNWSGPLSPVRPVSLPGMGSGSTSAQQPQARSVAATVTQLKARLQQAGAAARSSGTAQGGLVGSHPSTFGSFSVRCGAGGEGTGDGSSSALAQSGLGASLQSDLVGTASADLAALLQQQLQLLQLEQQHLRLLQLEQQRLQHPSSLQQQQSLAYGLPAAAAVPCASASLLPVSAGAAVHAALSTASLSARFPLGLGADVGDGCVGEGSVDVAGLAAAAAQQKLAELQQLEEKQQQLLGEVMTLLPLI